jgi:uncharacterized protein (UPF0216 family)
MSHPTHQQRIIRFNRSIQNGIDSLNNHMNYTRDALNELRTEERDIISINIEEHAFPAILVKNIIKFMRVEYARQLCILRFFTNIISNTLTKAHFDALHEKITDELELKFEVFGMKHHEEWSKESIYNYDGYKNMYKLYKQLYNIN